MEVLASCDLSEVVAGRGERRGTVADPAGCAVTTIEAAHTELLLVGPEGGFDEVESRVLDEAGWSRMYLGPHLLRAETAAVAGLTVLGLERERRGL
jgi:RsmE family RNA methyltransferase